MKTVFIFTKKSLRKYSVLKDDLASFVGSFSMDDIHKNVDTLFASSLEINNFEVYLARDIIFEDECEILANTSLEDFEKVVNNKLLENPLYDPQKHSFVFVGDKNKDKKLVTVFYFENTWLKLIEDVFTSKNYLPQKTGIVSTLYPEVLELSEKSPIVHVQWIKDLEIDLVFKDSLIYSRHITVDFENIDEGIHEITRTVEKLHKNIPDMNRSIAFFANDAKRTEIGEKLKLKQTPYMFMPFTHNHIVKKIDPNSRDDELLLFSVASTGINKAMIDISSKITIKDSKQINNKWLSIIAALFCLIGVLGFISMKNLERKTRRMIIGEARPYVPALSLDDISAIDILGKAGDNIRQRESFTDKPVSYIFSKIIFCIPRDSEWKLERFSKNLGVYEIKMVFSEDNNRDAFLHSLKRVDEWSLLEKRKGFDIIRLQVNNK